MTVDRGGPVIPAKAAIQYGPEVTHAPSSRNGPPRGDSIHFLYGDGSNFYTRLYKGLADLSPVSTSSTQQAAVIEART